MGGGWGEGGVHVGWDECTCFLPFSFLVGFEGEPKENQGEGCDVKIGPPSLNWGGVVFF